jgi:hypothetical protein
MTVHDLPSINATLNAIAALLLIWGYTLIRRKRIQTHRKVMIAAFITSSIFLVCYIVYHVQIGAKSMHFLKTGPIRTAYFTLLTSHTILAAAVPGPGDHHAKPRSCRPLRQTPQNRPLDSAHLAVCQRHRRDRLPDALSHVTNRPWVAASQAHATLETRAALADPAEGVLRRRW